MDKYFVEFTEDGTRNTRENWSRSHDPDCENLFWSDVVSDLTPFSNETEIHNMTSQTSTILPEPSHPPPTAKDPQR